jgi:glutathione S-transferase
VIEFYDLAGRDGRRFSPNCWRTRMALAHKGLEHRAVPVHFADIPQITDGKQKTVPVIVDGGVVVADSWKIANYLEETYPDRPSLFGGAPARALTLFVQSWTAEVLHRHVISLILHDIYLQLDEGDKSYFRNSREKRFGRTLEEVQSGREIRAGEFRASLQPLRIVLQTQPWLGGASPYYADFLIFGAFQWARVVSSFALLPPDDVVAQWFERCLDLFGGLGRRALPSA